MTEITDFDREWVKEIAGREVSDEEILEFLGELQRYEDSLEISPDIFTGE